MIVCPGAVPKPHPTVKYYTYGYTLKTLGATFEAILMKKVYF